MGSLAIYGLVLERAFQCPVLDSFIRCLAWEGIGRLGHVSLGEDEAGSEGFRAD